ncbi:hypothetical protein AUK11_02370 [bacterium CG2_30_37_16]|nr:MAG: hypothetical protein AUK11_02370 [bacterium CG2_30_37_16]PIP31176.1 MAG: hypothetical protein COX25_00870 [bacterium (Candidatus Howlettbacteria) CG23_combo_of_CG06-09_8_20_14_all_37_9]PIY00085.1 MAG: hypothetical protein COZ22_01065 [bacterium (Candidatus Howlettbacteria) CG_4_10_14_3_um_filter_37_10]PJB06548.1 MAG: hypothetical protein CO123_01875 [bacterium (Candidatus Howlettbacteria) CG_4_9_14_3_um_filter_37_10]
MDEEINELNNSAATQANEPTAQPAIPDDQNDPETAVMADNAINFAPIAGDDKPTPRIEDYEATSASTIEQMAAAQATDTGKETIAATPPPSNTPEPPMTTDNGPIYVDINAYENSYKMAQSDDLKVDTLTGEA